MILAFKDIFYGILIIIGLTAPMSASCADFAQQMSSIPIRSADDESYVNDFFGDLLTQYFEGHNREEYELVVVAHMLPTLPPLMEALDHIGEVRVIIPKNLANQAVVGQYINKIPKELLDTEDRKAFFRSKENVEALFTKYLNEEKKFLIVDIGGYFAEVYNFLKEKYSDRLVGIIEDTENGHRRYEASGFVKVKDPIVSVARCPVKEAEDFNVAKSLVQATDSILREVANTFIERQANVGVIGGGKIGSGIAEHLSERHIKNLMLTTKSPGSRNFLSALKQSSKGQQVVDRETLISTSDLIFAATGNKSLSGADFYMMKDNVFISSCTSADDELDTSLLEKIATSATSTKVGSRAFIVQYKIPVAGGYKRINILNGGNAVNFVYDAVNGPYVYGLLGSLVVAASHIIKHTMAVQSAGKLPVFGLSGAVDAYDMQEVSRLWLARFGGVKSDFFQTASLAGVESILANPSLDNDTKAILLQDVLSKVRPASYTKRQLLFCEIIEVLIDALGKKELSLAGRERAEAVFAEAQAEVKDTPNIQSFFLRLRD